MCTDEHFEQKNLTQTNFRLPFEQGGKSCRCLGKTLLVDLSKLHAMCSEKHFETRRFFFAKKTLFQLCLLILNAESADVGKNFNNRVSKLSSMWPVELFENSFVGESCNFLSSYCFIWGKSWFSKLQVCQEGFLGLQRKTLGDNSLEEIKIICFSWALIENLSGFRQNEFDRVAKTVAHVIMKLLEQNGLFKKNQLRIIFPRLSERVLDSWQKCPQGELNP